MTPLNNKKTIYLVGKEPEVATRVGNFLKAMPDIDLESIDETLSDFKPRTAGFNGTANTIIFRTQGCTDQDVAALQSIARARQDKTILLALADSSATLTDVRRLARAGAHEVLPDSVTFEELEEQVRKWTTPTEKMNGTSQAANVGHSGKVISVTQARGGVGSTTLAVNLADHLLDRAGLLKKTSRNRVALVDLDLQFGAVASFLDVEPNDALYQMAMDGMEPDAVFLNQSMIKLPSGLSVLSAPSRFAPLSSLQKNQLSTLIDLLRNEFDYVVIDLPRALVEWLSPILEQTDRMLMVTDSSVPSIHQARRLINFYTEDNLGLKIEIVVNHERKPLVKGRHHAEAAKVLERPLSHWLPDDPKAAREAVDRGIPLSDAAGRSSLNKSIDRLAHNLISGFAAESANHQSKR